MAKPELGTKRTCQSCGAKYYDLSRDPITCPKCGAGFVATVLLSSAAMARAARADARKKVVDDEEEEVAEVAPLDEDAEAISLEDADEETAGAVKKAKPAADPDEDDVEEADEDEEADDESFLEPDEGDEDVADIIGDREKDDET